MHRWHYLLIGATDEDSAQALAERLRGEAPEGSEVLVEQNRRVVYEHRPFNPFTCSAASEADKTAAHRISRDSGRPGFAFCG